MNNVSEAADAARSLALDLDAIVEKAIAVRDLLTSTSIPANPAPCRAPRLVPTDLDREMQGYANIVSGLDFSEAAKPDSEMSKLFELPAAPAAPFKCYMGLAPRDEVKMMEKFQEIAAGFDFLNAARAKGVMQPSENYRVSRRMENYLIGDENSKSPRPSLSPIQIQIGEIMAKEDVIVNVSRRFGATTMIAAYVRQQQVSGHDRKILVLTNNRTNQLHLVNLIDDSAVTVMEFSATAQYPEPETHYTDIIVDNAANIPYAIEDQVRAYISKCKSKYNIWQHETYAEGYTHEDTRVALISVPGEDRGWFYEEFTRDDDVRKLTVGWQWSRMTPRQAMSLKLEAGALAFANQCENQFRPARNRE